jgi:Spy/CpxP family protein refolding chaperone
MKTVKYVAAILVVLTIGLATSQAVQWPQRQHRPGPVRAALRPGIVAMADEIGLTSEQQTKLRQSRLATKRETIELGAKLRILRLELRELLQADQPDQKAVQAKVKEIGELRTKIELARINGRLAARSVLTAEQREKIKELRKRHLRQRFDRRLRERPHRPMRQPRPMPPEERLDG